MQGKLPCHDCPYGQICEECPELIARAEGKKVYEKGGFYSQEIRETIGPPMEKNTTIIRIRNNIGFHRLMTVFFY